MLDIKTYNSSVFIHRDDLANALKTIKRMLNVDLKIAYASTLYEALEFCGWLVKKDEVGNITNLEYSSDHWRDEAESIIRCISRYIKPGSFIVIHNKRHNKYWRLDFSGSPFPIRTTLKKEILDTNSEKQMKCLFKKSAKALLGKGFTSKALCDIINEQCVDLVMKELE